MFQLVYLWVEKFRTLENIGINFHPAFEFEFDKNTGILELKNFYKDKLEDDYFPKNQFISVIVGKNGTGKSSILDLIELIKKKKTKKYTYFFLFMEYSKSLENSKFLTYKSRDLKIKENIIKTNENFLDNYIYNLNDKTNFIKIGKDIKKESISCNKAYVNDLSRLLKGLLNCKDKTYFLLKEMFNNFDSKYIKFPEEVYGNIEFSLNEVIDNFKGDKETEEFQVCFENLSNLNKHNLSNLEKIKLILLSIYLYNFVENKLKDKKYEKGIKNFCKDLSKIIKSNSIDNLLGEIKNKFLKNDYFDDFYNFTKILETFTNNLNKHDNKIEIKNDNIKIHLGEFTKVNNLLIQSFLKLLLYDYGNHNIFFEYEPPLSTGQETLLSLFSEISEKLDKDDCNNIDRKENILLLLDEPDVYLHPEWQRLFIYFLTSFLKEKYPNKNFHIILTTHSPFLLSDIPKEKVIFLDLNDNYKTIVKSRDEISDTLAQNIYYLLSDGFFMEKGIGEYISHKLKEFLEKINNGNLTEEDKEKFKKLINRIGDKALRHKLKHILNNKEFYKGELFKKEENQ